MTYISESNKVLNLAVFGIALGAGGRVFRAKHRLQSSPYYAVKVFRSNSGSADRGVPPEVARECEADANAVTLFK